MTYDVDPHDGVPFYVYDVDPFDACDVDPPLNWLEAERHDVMTVACLPIACGCGALRCDTHRRDSRDRRCAAQLLMERMDRGSFHHLLKQCGRVPERMCLAVCRKVLSGLACVHRRFDSRYPHMAAVCTRWFDLSGSVCGVCIGVYGVCLEHAWSVYSLCMERVRSIFKACMKCMYEMYTDVSTECKWSVYGVSWRASACMYVRMNLGGGGEGCCRARL
jgi:hypothetical protein